jgi:hypothetical protein
VAWLGVGRGGDDRAEAGPGPDQALLAQGGDDLGGGGHGDAVIGDQLPGGRNAVTGRELTGGDPAGDPRGDPAVRRYGPHHPSSALVRSTLVH